ncbi:MAG TPA: hypothetical protein VF650_04210 [Allosphingosinicella sp.]
MTFLPILALAACAEEPRSIPSPDPALIERIALADTAEPPEPKAAEKLEKLEKADKLVAAVAHVAPERVAGAAEKLLAR